MFRIIRRLGDDQRGATAVEYGLILALIVVAILAALFEFAGASVSMWYNISTRIQQVQTAS